MRLRDENSQQRPDFFWEVTFQSSMRSETTVGVAMTRSRSVEAASMPATVTALRATVRAGSPLARRRSMSSSLIWCGIGGVYPSFVRRGVHAYRPGYRPGGDARYHSRSRMGARQLGSASRAGQARRPL